MFHMLPFDEKQQKRLESFFREETTWFPEHVLINFGACILVISSIFLICIPHLYWAKDNDALPFFIYVLYGSGIVIYGSRFSTYYEYGKNETHSMYDLMRCLPISKRQLLLYKLKKMAKPCLIITLAVMLVRIFFSLALFHAFSFYDVFTPLIGTLLLPLVMGIDRNAFSYNV